MLLLTPGPWYFSGKTMEVLIQYSALIYFTVLIYIYCEDAPGGVCRSKEMCPAKKLFFSNFHSFYLKIKYCLKMLQASSGGFAPRAFGSSQVLRAALGTWMRKRMERDPG